MYDNRYSRDDIIPMLADDGIATTLAPWLRKNVSEEFLQELIQMEHGIILLTSQIKQTISDLISLGTLDGADPINLPSAINRPNAPSGLGCNSATGSVWISAPANEFIIRFYCNGIQKTSIENYNFTDLNTLDATSGDIIQVCQLLDDVPGWWARISVS